MRLDFSEERVLAVVAHPDDCELLCAGTLARARDADAPIGLCVLCQGEKGQGSATSGDLAEVRRKELEAATKILGAELFRCEFGDGTLFDSEEQRRTLIEVLRVFRPTLVLAHAPNDYHPDHRAASALTEAASWFCASRGHRTASPPLDSPPALWWMDTVNAIGFEPGFYVDVSNYVQLKESMLMCHKSQLQRERDQDFAPLLKLLRAQQAARGAQAGVRAAEAFRIHTAWKRARAW